MAAVARTGMDEQDMTDGQHDGSWVKKAEPLEVPDESLRPELAPENLETNKDLDNVVNLPPPSRMEDPTDAPDAVAAK